MGSNGPLWHYNHREALTKNKQKKINWALEDLITWSLRRHFRDWKKWPETMFIIVLLSPYSWVQILLSFLSHGLWYLKLFFNHTLGLILWSFGVVFSVWLLRWTWTILTVDPLLCFIHPDLSLLKSYLATHTTLKMRGEGHAGSLMFYCICKYSAKCLWMNFHRIAWNSHFHLNVYLKHPFSHSV